MHGNSVVLLSERNFHNVNCYIQQHDLTNARVLTMSSTRLILFCETKRNETKRNEIGSDEIKQKE